MNALAFNERFSQVFNHQLHLIDSKMSYVNGASNIAIAILFPTVGAITLSLRYYARFKIGQGLGVDDICSTIALVRKFQRWGP